MKKTLKFCLSFLISLILIMSTLNIQVFAASLSDTQVNSAINWAVSKLGNTSYDGYCLSFVQDAYQQAGVSFTRLSDATTAGNAWCSHPGDYNPVYGALCFYDYYGTYNGITKNWGHVGIYVGNGRVISALSTVKYTNIDISGCTYRGWGVIGNYELPGTQSSNKPTLTSPSDGTTIQLNTSTNFSWSNTGASRYQITFTNPAGSNTDIYVTSQTNCNFTPNISGTWYWKVRSNTDTGITGEWSAERSFTVPGSVPPNPTGSIHVQYFNGVQLSGNVISEEYVDSINKNWGSGSPSGISSDAFSARFTQQASFSGGWYKFHYEVDDCIKIWIDGDCKVDKWGSHVLNEDSQAIYISAGTHTVIAEYADTGGDAKIIVNCFGTTAPAPIYTVDLSPTQIIYDTANVTVGTQLYLDSGVINSGNIESNAFNVAWYINDSLVAAGSHGAVPANTAILDGNSGYYWEPCSPGTYTIRFVVDYDNQIGETNENNNETSVTINVTKKPVIGVSLDKTTTSLKVGESANLTATVDPVDASNTNTSWSSNNTAVATVDSSGKVTAVGAGTATITVTSEDGGFTANCSITVSVVPKDVQVVSLVGTSRYDTAVRLSQSQFSTADTIVIVNGGAMADGLGATPLAKYKNAPLLLTETNSLPEGTINEIQRLKPQNAIIVGGTGVVSDNVKNQLQGLGLIVERISGTDRYCTSLEVAKYIGKNCYDVSKVVISNGNGEADALSIASVAGRDNMPIILVGKDNISGATYDWLKSEDLKDAYIIGGSGVVSDNVLNEINAITSNDIKNNRLGGKNRFETNSMVIDRFYGSFIDKIYIAKGYVLIDALAAGPVAAINGSPVVITDNDLNTNQKTVLGSRNGNTIIRTGGGISDTAVNDLKSCLQ